MRDFKCLIDSCDEDIRRGRPHDVARRLSELNSNRIPREWRAPLARICRRAGLLPLGLRLLSKVVNDGNGEATTPERAEYAMLLLRSGAVTEATTRLQALDPSELGAALLFRAYAHFAVWEHEAAIPLLERYVRLKLEPGALLVGRTNLAFAYVECRRYDPAWDAIDEAIGLARAQSHPHLESFNLAVLAQAYLQTRDFDRAREQIARAAGNTAGVPSPNTNDQLYVAKLRLILEGLESRSLAPFAALTKLARSRRDWVALRDSDLFSLKVDFDLKRFLHLYFGSPFDGLRSSIQQELGVVTEERSYVLGPKSAPRFDLLTGQLDGRALDIAGGKSHQLIEGLLRDFYQPCRIAGLFSLLFPGEWFDVATSPDRVRQVIRRTRAWIRTNRLPIAVQEEQGFYSLALRGNLSFLVPVRRQEVDLLSLQLRRLGALFGPGALFSAQELCRRLEISTTSAHRLLSSALERGLIERIGPLKRPLGYRLRSPEASALARAA